MMKKHRYFALILLLALSMTACSDKQDPDIPAHSSSPSSATSTSETSENQENDAQTKQVGEEGYGFVTVPLDWVNFQDIDGAGESIQFSDPSGTKIITLLGAIPGGYAKEDVAANISAQHAAQGEPTVEWGKGVQVDGNDALRGEQYWKDEDIVLFTWLFEEEGNLHLVTSEGPLKSSEEIIALIEDHYTVNQKTAKSTQADRIGADGYGFVRVTDDWMEVRNAENRGEKVPRHFTSPAGDFSITLSPATPTTTQSLGEYAGEIMHSLRMQPPRATDMKLEESTALLEGIDVLRIRHYYEDLDTAMFTWVFIYEGEGYVLSAQGPLAYADEVISLVEGNYSIN